MRLLLASVYCALFSLSSARLQCRCNGNFRTRDRVRQGECTTKIGRRRFCYVPEGACDDQRESNTRGLFYSFQACDTITAKFWAVTDLKVDSTSFADKAVKAMNTALKNSKIPLKYKRQGSVGRLRVSTKDLERRAGENFEDYNEWLFYNGLGGLSTRQAAEDLKDGADHVVFLYHGSAEGRCLTISSPENFFSSTTTIQIGASDVKAIEKALACICTRSRPLPRSASQQGGTQWLFRLQFRLLSPKYQIRYDRQL